MSANITRPATAIAGCRMKTSRSLRATAVSSERRPEALELGGDLGRALQLPPVQRRRIRHEAGAGPLGETCAEARRRVRVVVAPEHEARRRDTREVAFPLRGHPH